MATAIIARWPGLSEPRLEEPLKLLRPGAGCRRCTVIVLREPADDGIAIAREALVVDEGRVQTLQDPVHAASPLRNLHQFLQADEIAADAEDDGATAR